MSVTVYVPKENGDLKYIAEVEDEDRPDMALDAVLDEMPRLANQHEGFIALVGDFEDGRVVTLVVGDEPPIQRPKRTIAVSNIAYSNGGAPTEEVAAPRRRGRPPKAASAATTDAPRRRGRPPGSKNRPKDETGSEAPRRRGRPPGSKNKPKEAATTTDAPKRRGRPPGSKNKPKVAAGAKKTPFTRRPGDDD